ncbi:MAG TPA: TIGR03435 family protein [Bryobacteraceae bacterium]|jgi:uncharacterized protein (TIGR03435 family)
MKSFLLPILAAPIVLTTALSAQSPAGRLEFEVASVRAVPPLQPDQVNNMGLHMDGSQARIASFALKDYIAMAYRVKAYQISGPDQLSDRFDLNAKLPAGATSEQIPEMLQAFLADRFQLKFHREKKELPVYALVLGKLPLKLKEVPDDADPSAPGARDVAVSGSEAGVSVDLGHGSSYSFANNKFEGKKFSMDVLAAQLERYLDRPIVNLTELKAKYDITLEITQEDYQAMLVRVATSAGLVLPPQVLRFADANTPTSLFDAIQQTGLKLDARKAPIDFLVVDQVLKTPTVN